ncbi:hypothetical protein ACS5PN_03915 [Roseateles sp. NT4]|uniref:hypothetical protein n=1 Tax=Roseateles sp. NT4 TaxID=3453715 RepID=UPI003EEE99E3
MSGWDSRSGGLPLFLHVALGVFIGSLAASFVLRRVVVWQAQVAAAELAAELARQAAAVDADVKRTQAANQAVLAAKRAQFVQAQNADEQAKRQISAEAGKRAAAWGRYYRKPASCDEARGGSWTVDCSNEFIRANKRFAELYEAGKL